MLDLLNQEEAMIISQGLRPQDPRPQGLPFLPHHRAAVVEVVLLLAEVVEVAEQEEGRMLNE